MEKRTHDALQHASKVGCNTKHVTRSAYVYEGRPIHCKRCGYTPEYSLSRDNGWFCPCCGSLIIDRRDLDDYEGDIDE